MTFFGLCICQLLLILPPKYLLGHALLLLPIHSSCATWNSPRNSPVFTLLDTYSKDNQSHSPQHATPCSSSSTMLRSACPHACLCLYRSLTQARPHSLFFSLGQLTHGVLLQKMLRGWHPRLFYFHLCSTACEHHASQLSCSLNIFPTRSSTYE